MKYDIKNLTLQEKIRMLNGVGAWRIYNANGKVKEVFMSDGPNGVHRRDDITKASGPATAVPNMVTVANTWNRELAYLDGETIAQDCIEYNIDILLAPGVNIKRTPLCGRNFEYVSEDPYLAGELAAQFVNGVQSQGIGTSLKHFCANNREEQRCFQSSEVDERTLYEIYMKPFETVVKKANPWTVMCSYNPVNGVYTSENKKLLKGVLRDKFGFDGLIMSDWGAVHSCYKAAKATLDLEMPYNKTSVAEMTEAYEKGLISEEEIDACIINILKLIEKTECDKKVKYDKKTRHENAVEIANEGIVLLKNDNVLPLKDGNILMAYPDEPAPLGGGGSAEVKTDFVQTNLAQLVKDALPNANVTSYNRWSKRGLLVEAYDADTIVYRVNASAEAENVDRTTLRLPYTQEEIILALAKTNKKVIVVIYGGSAVDVSPWADKVSGILFCGFCGEASNEALADILCGKVCPSGKLSETFPVSVEDTPSGLTRGNTFTEWYKEGIFVGYRYFDEYNIPVMYPFGYGLSYAKFEYSNLEIEKISETDYKVSYDITNVSNVDGKEISQVYVKDVFAMVSRPQKELKGFSKDLIKAGETKRVSVMLNSESFAYYNVSYDKWFVENGAFEIMVGASSQDIKLVGKININLPEETQQSTDTRDW
ncbi:MAG: glycoside hydrolase family 3 C-terminal domain-containing protein [Clostridia bacterium]|nr:glycoside hydrolase family 3 C-terminal domain-containing protein [Clostridia bacterium]